MPFPDMLDSSLREEFNNCHHKFFRTAVCELAPKGESVHLVAGGAYARGLEVYRTLLANGVAFEEAAAEGFVALIQSYGPHEAPPDSSKRFDRVVAAYIEHLYRYPPERELIKPSIGPAGPRVEFSFTFEIPGVLHPDTGNPLLYAGRTDMLAEYNGVLFVFDDKTSSHLGASWADRWQLRSQLTGYVVGAESAGLQVIGAIVRGAALLKTKIDMAECITHRPRWMVERWKERLVWDAKRMIQCYKDNYWPQTGEESGACAHYGPCKFLPLCQSQQPEAFIPVYYDKRKWNPITRGDDT